MKHIETLFTLAFLLLFQACVGQWADVTINPSKRIDVLNFLNDNVGYAMMIENGNSTKTLEKTTDGGNTWAILNLPVQGQEFQDLYFSANGVGVALYRNLQNMVTPTMIFQTLNDGISWQDISPDSTATGIGTAQCQFLNPDTGFFATDQFFYSTIDGGATWTSQMLVGYTMALDFMDANHGTVGLFDGTFNYFGGILSTTNGGATWNTTLLNGTGNGTVIGEVGQLTPNIAYAAPVKFGAYGQHRFFKTTNNGTTWDTILVPDTLSNGTLSDIDFKDEMHGVISVSSFTVTYMYKTINGGVTWTFTDSLPLFTVSDLQLTANTGYLSGELGKFYKLTLALNAAEPIAERLQIYPNPAHGGQRIQWTGSDQRATVSILDITGKTVANFSLIENGLTLPDLLKGIYFFRLEGKNGSNRLKLLVE